MIVGLIQMLLSVLTLLSIGYYFLCVIAAKRFFSRPASCPISMVCPPVTIMIPLCGADFKAYHNYASFLSQDYPEYEVVFGVQNPEDSSMPVIRKLIEDFPDKAITLVVSTATIGENPKVSNLSNMLKEAKYDHIVIADSDILVGQDFLRSVVPHLSGESVGLVTCFYTGAEALNLPSKLEFIGISTEFAPGVLVARLMEGMSFALGATMVTTKQKLECIGGFKAIADYLADDYMLGHLLWKAGHEIRLSPYIVETTQAAVSFIGMIKHQIRWGRGIRACRPAGHLGAIITHGTVLAALNLSVHFGSVPSILLLGLALTARLGMGWFVGVRCLGDKTLKTSFWLIPLRDLLSFLIWCASLVGRKVEWRGRVYRIVEGGKIVPI